MRISDWSSDVCSSDLPWIYSNEVEMDDADKAVPLGGLVRLCGPQGHYLATAFFNRHTLIAARVLTRAEAVDIGAGFFAARIRSALRSEARRVGKECVSKGRSGWGRYQ